MSFSYEAIEKILKGIPKEIFEKLMNETFGEGDREHYFMAALDEGDVELLKSMVEIGYDINAPIREYTDNSYLLRTVRNKNLETTRFLLENGIKLKNSEDPGYLAIFYAAETSDISFMKLLVEHGADVNATIDNYGRQVGILHFVELQKRKEIYHYLLTIKDKFSPENQKKLKAIRLRMLF